MGIFDWFTEAGAKVQERVVSPPTYRPPPTVTAPPPARGERPLIKVAEREGRTYVEREGRLVETLPSRLRTKKQRLERQAEVQTEYAKAREINISRLAKRIQAAPIKDGKFVGTDLQYKRYAIDIKQHNFEIGKYNRLRTHIERSSKEARAAGFGGLVGKYDRLNKRISEKIPTTAELAVRFPRAAKEIREIKKIPAVTVIPTPVPGIVRVKPLKRDIEFAEGLYAGVREKPLKAAITAAAFVAGGPVVAGLTKIPLIAPVARVVISRPVVAGMGALYTGVSAKRIAGAPPGYERGRVTGDIIFNEVVPMFAGGYVGTKLITGVPGKPRLKPRPGFEKYEGPWEVTDFRKQTSRIAKFKKTTRELLMEEVAEFPRPRRERIIRKREKLKIVKDISPIEYSKRIQRIEMLKPQLRVEVKEPKKVITAKELFEKRDIGIQKRIKAGELMEIRKPDGTIQLVKTKQIAKMKQEIEQVSIPKKEIISARKVALQRFEAKQAKAVKMRQIIRAEEITVPKVKRVVKVKLVPIQKLDTKGMLAVAQIYKLFQTAVYKMSAKEMLIAVPLLKTVPVSVTKAVLDQKMTPAQAQKYVQKYIAKMEPVAVRVPKPKVIPKPKVKVKVPIPKIKVPPIPALKIKKRKKRVVVKKIAPVYTPTQMKNTVATLRTLFG